MAKDILKGIAVFIVGAVVGGLLAGSFSAKDSTGGVYNAVQKYFYDGISVGTTGQFTVSSLGVVVQGAAVSNTASWKLGTNSVAKTISTSGTCNLWTGGNTTIAATTTATFDCQAGTTAASALTDVPAWAVGDRVFLTQSTTTVTTNEGIRVLSATGSTTAGYIAVKIQNLTGASYTIASSSMSGLQYLYER